MTQIIAIRPQPGLASTQRLGRDYGMDIGGQALFDIRGLQWDCPDPASVDALLIGSANAIAHVGPHLEALRNKPVFAVGKATAKAARDAGFEIANKGTGGLQNVLDTIRGPKRLLRIAGAEHVPLDHPAGVSIHTVIAYESVALSLDCELLESGSGNLLVLLHSAAAASHFVKECERLALDRRQIAIAALGPRIADAAGSEWRAIHVADHPSDPSLLEMVRDRCI